MHYSIRNTSQVVMAFSIHLIPMFIISIAKITQMLQVECERKNPSKFGLYPIHSMDHQKAF